MLSSETDRYLYEIAESLSRLVATHDRLVGVLDAALADVTGELAIIRRKLQGLPVLGETEA